MEDNKTLLMFFGWALLIMIVGYSFQLKRMEINKDGFMKSPEYKAYIQRINEK